MIAALIIGAGAGIGFLAAAWALVPPRTDLAAAVGQFDTQRARARLAGPMQGQGWRGHLGYWLSVQTAARGWAMPTVRANLALLDRSFETYLVTKLLTAAVGLVLPVTVVIPMLAAGINVGMAVPALIGIALALGFSILPDLSVSRDAAERRDELRRALACYLDLVSMALAGGRGAPEALPSAAHIGQGWAFELIADTLAHARYRGVSSWEALSELGQRVNVSELRDLGNALSLVSDDGAKIKESLRARATTARNRQLAESEGAAEKGSESIKNAHLLLGFAFLVFLGYPAVAAVMAV